MKKIFLHLLVIAAGIMFAICNTACKNEYKDMLPNEVRLKENTYHNDDKIQDIQYCTGEDTVTMSALEVRTIWHATVIDAEKHFTENTDSTKNLYESPIHAEEAFYKSFSNSMQMMQEAYPLSHQPITQELVRAGVKVDARYIWCVGSEEYLDLKFTVMPEVTSTPTETEEK
jgi:hypothetical protein